jgi:hypothetical protein
VLFILAFGTGKNQRDGLPSLVGLKGAHTRRPWIRVTAVGVAVVAALAVIAVVFLTQPPSKPRSGPTTKTDPGFTAGTVPTVSATRPVQTTTTEPATTTTTSDPGLLPQTDVFPSSDTAQFTSEMADLWQAVVTGSGGTGRPAFFPESAYLQLKRIASPGSDYTNRLLYDFDADILAAHGLLGSDPSAAKLTQVIVPSGYGHWVPPGVCDNSIGYYEVPNSRIVYNAGGQVRSFGIASMISWRGTWYVVHLGAILRSTDAGMVDNPAVGDGTSLYSSTC